LLLLAPLLLGSAWLEWLRRVLLRVVLLAGRLIALRLLGRIALTWVALARALLLMRRSRVCKLLDFRLSLSEELVEGARHGEDVRVGGGRSDGSIARAEGNDVGASTPPAPVPPLPRSDTRREIQLRSRNSRSILQDVASAIEAEIALNMNSHALADQSSILTDTDQFSSSPVAFNHRSKETTARILHTLAAMRLLLQVPSSWFRPVLPLSLAQVFTRVTQLTSQSIAGGFRPDRQQG
jgi:hypothetical protein